MLKLADQQDLCSRKVNATESAMVATVTQTATSTTTYVVQCTNSLIHKPEDACGDSPFFSYEAPVTCGFRDLIQ